jgi:hypothetical protein
MRKSKYNRSKSRKFRKSRKNRTRRNYPKYKKFNIKARGPSPDDVKCCMCDQQVSQKDTFIPLACRQKYGINKSHKICHNCWWDPNTGFARENAPHGCPGCKQGLPLNRSPKRVTQKTDEIIVISD